MEDIVAKFKNSLSEIMTERNVDIVQLGMEISIDRSTPYKWFDSVRDVKLKTLITLANYFQCSLEYLCGKTQEYVRVEPQACVKFGDRIKEIMKEYNLIPYKFLNEVGITPSKYYYWLSGGEPMLSSLDAMAKYLDITLDKLVGRDK